MKFLLVEDDSNKSKHILDFLEETYPDTKTVLRRSYQSGLKEIFSNEYNLILLDMQLPTFDIKSGEDGYKFRKLAGVDILNELKRKNFKCKIIIVTQFETFGEGEYFIELKDLKESLMQEYKELYIDTVYYNASQTTWKKELKDYITKYCQQND
jgi:CheY-like chemotaxis protein